MRSRLHKLVVHRAAENDFLNVSVLAPCTSDRTPRSELQPHTTVCFCGMTCHGRCAKCGYETPAERRGRRERTDPEDQRINAALAASLDKRPRT